MKMRMRGEIALAEFEDEKAKLTALANESEGQPSATKSTRSHFKVMGTLSSSCMSVSSLIGSGVQPHEIALFVRSVAQLSRPKAAADQAGVKYKVLDDRVEVAPGFVSVSTMHLAKGLEFRAVAVMGCDDEVIPLQERIETVTDEGDLEDVYNTERHLLYVACTRARDNLLVTSTSPKSEFLDDLV